MNQTLNLPAFEHQIVEKAGKQHIFDVFRKKYVSLTPEEWVRQHFLHWIVREKAYPAGLIAVEASLVYNKMARRADAIVYGRDGKALMIIECKASEIKITQDVFDQAAMYNFPMGVRYLVITNGIDHYCCFRENNTWTFLDDVPGYHELDNLSQT